MNPGKIFFLLLSLVPFFPVYARTVDAEWSLGLYGGMFYNTSPIQLFMLEKPQFRKHYILATNGTRTLWQSESWPVSVVMDVVVARQSGQANLTEVSAAPVLQWSGFPWSNRLRTVFGFGPFGASWLSKVSPLERSSKGGSPWLNFLVLEVAFAHPAKPRDVLFIRLHHRCGILGLLNDYGMNGEDFLVVGYRRHF